MFTLLHVDLSIFPSAWFGNFQGKHKQPNQGKFLIFNCSKQAQLENEVLEKEKYNG
jgi:hypothetical protein